MDLKLLRLFEGREFESAGIVVERRLGVRPDFEVKRLLLGVTVVVHIGDRAGPRVHLRDMLRRQL